MRSATLVLAAAATALVAPALAHAGTGTGLLRYLPDSASAVVVVDVAHARSGAAIGKLVQRLRESTPRWEALAADGVALDAMIDTLVAGSDAGIEDPHGRHVTIVIDGKLGPLLAHLKTPASPATRHAGVTYWMIDGGEVAIVDRHLLITTAGDMAGAIDRARGKGASAASSPKAAELRDVLAASASSGADVWGGLVFEPSSRTNLRDVLMGSEPTWVAFAIAAAGRASLEIRLAFVAEPAARSAVTFLQHTLVGPDSQAYTWMRSGIGSDFADSFSVEQDASQVRMSAAMTVDEADQVGKLLGTWL